jgi:alpha/beta superfamily hydrolase
MPRKIESLFLQGPAGRLEALLEEPEEQAPREAALVCHPHPQHGGTMHNKVVYRIARGLRGTGAVVLRFNYRGVNLSEGTYADGEGELGDARAALEFLRRRYPELPYTLAGFSFGSRIILRLGCAEGGAKRLIAVGYPTSYRDSAYLNGCTTPRVFIQSTRDQFGPLEEIEPMVASLPEPKKLVLIEASDHFFSDALEKLEEAIATA